MSTQVSSGSATRTTSDTAVPFRLEVIVIPVTDVDRARDFYVNLGWRMDGEIGRDDGYRLVQLTPPGSGCSIIFGNGVTAAKPGSFDGLLLVVDDIDAARSDLSSRGVEVSEVYHEAGGGLVGGFHIGDELRESGRDPEGRSYGSYASFNDPDGNRFVLQEITERLPGRV